MSTSSEHVVPVRVYLAIFAALVLLTALTTWIAFVDLGMANVALMLGIAVTKATLVVLYFMHLRWSPWLTWVMAGGAFGWLAVMVVLTLADFVTRGLMG